MNSEDVKKLDTLLNYWIEHNQEHGQEFKEWADRVSSDAPEIAGELNRAADEMNKATDYLLKARKELDRREK